MALEKNIYVLSLRLQLPHHPCGHMFAIWALGNQPEFAASCSQVIMIYDLPSWFLTKKLGKLHLLNDCVIHLMTMVNMVVKLGAVM